MALKSEEQKLRSVLSFADTARSASKAFWFRSTTVRKLSYRQRQMRNCKPGLAQAIQKARNDAANNGPLRLRALSLFETTSGVEIAIPDLKKREAGGIVFESWLNFTPFHSFILKSDITFLPNSKLVCLKPGFKVSSLTFSFCWKLSSGTVTQVESIIQISH